MEQVTNKAKVQNVPPLSASDIEVEYMVLRPHDEESDANNLVIIPWHHVRLVAF